MSVCASSTLNPPPPNNIPRGTVFGKTLIKPRGVHYWGGTLFGGGTLLGGGGVTLEAGRKIMCLVYLADGAHGRDQPAYASESSSMKDTGLRPLATHVRTAECNIYARACACAHARSGWGEGTLRRGTSMGGQRTSGVSSCCVSQRSHQMIWARHLLVGTSSMEGCATSALWVVGGAIILRRASAY